MSELPNTQKERLVSVLQEGFREEKASTPLTAEYWMAICKLTP